MADGLIEKEWKTFCLACFGDMSSQQYIDLRRTFYGGASAVYFLVMNRLSKGQEPTEADQQLILDLVIELKRFNVEVKAGRA